MTGDWTHVNQMLFYVMSDSQYLAGESYPRYFQVVDYRNLSIKYERLPTTRFLHFQGLYLDGCFVCKH